MLGKQSGKLQSNFITVSKCKRGVAAPEHLVVLGLAPDSSEMKTYTDITLNLNLVHSIQHNKEKKVIVILYTTLEYFVIYAEEGEDDNIVSPYTAMREFLSSYTYSI